MKTKCLVFTIVFVLFSMGLGTSGFAKTTKAPPAPAPPTVYVNGHIFKTDVQPVIINGRILLPCRAIFEALLTHIWWDDKTQTVTARLGEKKTELQVGNKTAKVDGKEIILDVAPVIIKGKVLVPARFIAESLGARVDWYEKKNRVLIVLPPAGARYTHEQRKWVLGSDAIVKRVNGESLVYFGDENRYQDTITKTKKSLMDSWDIRGREDVFETFNWLKDGGHRAGFDAIASKVYGVSDDKFNDMLKQLDPISVKQYELVRANYQKVGSKSLIGWDYCRLVYVAEQSYQVGYLTYDEAMEEAMSAALILQRTFTSWEDMGDNYILGHKFWSGRTDSPLLEEAKKWLMSDPSSPWLLYRWDFPIAAEMDY